MRRLEAPAKALSPLVRPLPPVDREGSAACASFELDKDLRLIASIGAVEYSEWMGISAAFMPPATATVSRSSSDGYRAVLVAAAGPAGVDLETLDRIALNATPQDAWLADAERTLVDQAPEPVLELACHWVLKEAYGKALGVGLALPLDALCFESKDRAIMLVGAAAPAPGEDWWFGLYRRADLLLAIAYRRAVQTATPLAPAGRNPPVPLLDR